MQELIQLTFQEGERDEAVAYRDGKVQLITPDFRGVRPLPGETWTCEIIRDASKYTLVIPWVKAQIRFDENRRAIVEPEQEIDVVGEYLERYRSVLQEKPWPLVFRRALWGVDVTGEHTIVVHENQAIRHEYRYEETMPFLRKRGPYYETEFRRVRYLIPGVLKAKGDEFHLAGGTAVLNVNHRNWSNEMRPYVQVEIPLDMDLEEAKSKARSRVLSEEINPPNPPVPFRGRMSDTQKEAYAQGCRRLAASWQEEIDSLVREQRALAARMLKADRQWVASAEALGAVWYKVRREAAYGAEPEILREKPPSYTRYKTPLIIRREAQFLDRWRRRLQAKVEATKSTEV